MQKKKRNKYKVPKRFQPIFNFVKKILKIFYKKPKIINLAGELPDKSIIITNHSAKNGPIAFELFYPKFNVKWGAHQMLEGYSNRKAYLRDVFYIQKRGFKKAKASFLAGFEALFSKMFYKGMKFIPSYPDARITITIKDSVKVLDNNMSVTVFPEDSSNGYKEVLTSFFPGFVVLAERYYKLKGEDLPIIPVHYHLKKRIMVIGKHIYANKLLESGMNIQEVTEMCLEKVNGLFFDYIGKE